MGLDISHNAWSGAYSAFNRFRQAIARAMGGSWPPHAPGTEDQYPVAGDWYYGDDFSPETHPGLFALMTHSDCDGEISPEDCAKLADELEALLPALDAEGEGQGHLVRTGGVGGAARRMIAGCRAAASAGEPLEFA